MNLRNTMGLLATTLLVSLPAMAEHKTPTEAQCRAMVDGMVQSMKAAPLKTERDKQGAREVIERVERIVRDNRSRGASECESWAAIGKVVTSQ
ncbi:MAG: hypothetical protein KJ787_01050 [Gammaproteobacteria bacterium]|nr:hypothetical protein [Gammaproteobacteria bacterium]MBU1971363.1 hypothetical protein [Gammaproteobacteria bacterium]